MEATSRLIALLLLGVACCCNGQTSEGDACSVADGSQGVCKRSSVCPEIQQVIRKKERIVLCTYYRVNAIVCCPSNNGLSTTSAPRQPTRRRRPTLKPTTTTRRAKPVVTVTTPLPETMESRLQKVNLSKQKCEEYAAFVFYIRPSPLLMVGRNKIEVNTCAMVGQPLIAGGEKAIEREFPHMVALGYGTEDEVAWSCGGTLISENYILTAAHCANTRYGDVKWVRLGDLNIKNDADDGNHAITVAVEQIISHAGYNPAASENDIALLKLARSVKLGPYIRPACLYTEPNDPTQTNATVTGWGLEEANTNTGSADLMKADLTLRNLSVCANKFRTFAGKRRLPNGIVPETMICAGEADGARDTCEGDSGGPLQIRLRKPYYCMYSVIGLTSFSLAGCGLGETAGVYTRVSHYVPWIVDHVWPGSPQTGN